MKLIIPLIKLGCLYSMNHRTLNPKGAWPIRLKHLVTLNNVAHLETNQSNVKPLY